VTIPSFIVRPGQQVSVREKSRKVGSIGHALDGVARRGVPSWIQLNKDEYSALYTSAPTREDITMPIQEHLIVELYSK